METQSKEGNKILNFNNTHPMQEIIMNISNEAQFFTSTHNSPPDGTVLCPASTYL